MFRRIVQLALVALIIYGAYFYLIKDRDQKIVLDVPEVTYDQVKEVFDTAQEMATDIINSETPAEETPADETVTEEPATPEVVEDAAVTEEPASEENQIPEKFNLAVPFTSQAPNADWGMPYQEACEEASAYMVAEYYKGTPAGKVDPAVADAALLEVIKFETDYFGTYLDTTAAQTVEFIDVFYSLNARVIDNPTADMIKAEVAAGRPVIVPAAGRELGNPNFTGIGPLYHMLVIKGYTATQFITNDPGTRNGESYVYNIETIMSSMGDWNDGDPANGAKRVIFVSP